MDKIKLDVSGHGDLTSQPWEDGWDAIHGLAAAVREGVISDDSRVEGKLRVSVASKSEVREVNERFDSMKVEVDETLQQFEDREVCKGFLVNDTPISQSAFSQITTIGTKFQGNTKIKSFPELALCKEDTLRGSDFYGCSNLEYVDTSNIKRINDSPGNSLNTAFAGTKVKSFNVEKVTYVGAYPFCNTILAGPFYFKSLEVFNPFSSFNGDPYKVHLFFPSLKQHGYRSGWTDGWTVLTGNVELVDFGTNLEKASDLPNVPIFICRAANPITLSRAFTLNKGFFVPSASLSAYRSASNFSNITLSAIGGTEWRTAMRTLADQYAAEYAGWSVEQIASADYSDPYIDYRIFGLEPPTE